MAPIAERGLLVVAVGSHPRRLELEAEVAGPAQRLQGGNLAGCRCRWGVYRIHALHLIPET